MKHSRNTTLAAALVLLWVAGGTSASPIGTAFTYQGQLKQRGVAVNGAADFQFSLWNDLVSVAPGSQVGPTLIFDGQGPNPLPIDVANGLFTVQLDFGDDAFTGDARWLEITVTYPAGASPVTLDPRHTVTPAPYALALPALRTQQNVTSPNLLGGSSGNSVTAGVHGATIGGGGPGNTVTDAWGTVGGGASNRAGDGTGTTADAAYATVGGGTGNVASGLRSTIAGGRNNTASGALSAVGGGFNNTASNTDSTIAGGAGNDASGYICTIAGGTANTAAGSKSAVGGGEGNTAGGSFAAIPGGSNNHSAGNYSFAAGQRAQANHSGSFVWSDSTTADPDFFSSTGDNQFLIKAGGGVGINTNSPGASLHIGGVAGIDGLMFPDGTLQTTAAIGGGGDSLWTASGNNIFYTAGNVGIGTSLTVFRLNVKSTSGSAVYGSTSASSGNARGVLGDTASPDGAGVWGYNDAEVGAAIGVHGLTNSPTGFGGYFDGRGYFSDNVGIGVTNPTAKLHIGGTAGVDGLMFPDGTLQTSAAGNGGAGDGHSLDAADGSPVDAVFVDNNGNVNLTGRLRADAELIAEDGVKFEDAVSGTDLASLTRNADGHGQLVTFANGVSVASAVIGTDTEVNGAGGLALLSFDNALGPAVKLNSVSNAGRVTLARSTGLATIDETLVLYANAPKPLSPLSLTNSGGLDILGPAGDRRVTIRGNDGRYSSTMDFFNSDGAATVTIRSGDTTGDEGFITTQNLHVGGSTQLDATVTIQEETGIALNVNDSLLVTGTDANRFTGINRDYKAATDEAFGVGRAGPLASPDVGMYVESGMDGNPYYGYAIESIQGDPFTVAKHYFDSNDWTLELFDNPVLTVTWEGTLLAGDCSTDAPALEACGSTILRGHTVIEGRLGVNRPSLSEHPIKVGTDGQLDGNGAYLNKFGQWHSTSDRESKTDFDSIDDTEILSKLVAMPVMRWRYKGESDSLRHIGAVAQDFHAAFQLGDDDRHIGMVDADGIAFAAIKGLHQLVGLQETRIQELQSEKETEIAELRRRIAKLEALAVRAGDRPTGATR